MKKIIFFSIIILFGCNNGTNNNSNSTANKKSKIGKISVNLLNRSFGTNVSEDNKLDTKDGYFLQVNLSITNDNSDLLIFDSTFFKLTDETGNTYPFSNDKEALLRGFETTLNHSQIKPNESLDGFLVFNVPGIKKYELRIYDRASTKDSIVLQLESYPVE